MRVFNLLASQLDLVLRLMVARSLTICQPDLHGNFNFVRVQIYPSQFTVYRVHSTLVEHKPNLLSILSVGFTLLFQSQVYPSQLTVYLVHSTLVEHMFTLLSLLSVEGAVWTHDSWTCSSSSCQINDTLSTHCFWQLGVGLLMMTFGPVAVNKRLQCSVM